MFNTGYLWSKIDQDTIWNLPKDEYYWIDVGIDLKEGPGEKPIWVICQIETKQVGRRLNILFKICGNRHYLNLKEIRSIDIIPVPKKHVA